MASRAPSDGFTIVLGLASPVSELVAWFEQAAAGETVTYASGVSLPRETEGVKLVQAWQREGLVHFKQHRDPAEPRRWLFLAERSSAGPKGPRPRRDSSAEVARIQQRKLLDVLRGCADRGEACPSRTRLAIDLIGHDGRKARDRIGYLLRLLEADGKISTVPGDATRAPVITILAKGRGHGKATAEARR